nr:antiviral reverse transcriptase Drt3b [uncultured Roseibium sp.]
MATKRNLSKFSKQRAVLSDMLPFETPPSFSNGGYFNFLSRYNVRIVRGHPNSTIEWDCDDGSCDTVILLLFAITPPFNIEIEQVTEFGRTFSRRRIQFNSRNLRTQPFHFEIAHKETDSRRLTIVHPRNQLEVANFYHNNSHLITYYASLSPFSLRKPASVAKDVFYDDKLHKKRLGEYAALREESHKEYQYLASYFTYEKYSNIYRFYESYGYHKAERSFVRLLKLDISKCFDSIYTHSMPWALLGGMATKDHLAKSKKTFGGRFDTLLQDMNNGETNGIVIGPEFSRIFAELILQEVDNELQRRLRLDENLYHKVDFEIFRYVDDFFVFHRTEVQAQLIERHLTAILREFKLNLNTSKAITIEKPIITNLTIAKSRVHAMLAERIEKNLEKKNDLSLGEEVDIFAPKVNANKIIIEFKTILTETKTTYHENLNYTFAAIEKAFKSLCSKFRINRRELSNKNSSYEPDEQLFIDALIGLLEFSFFIYSSAQRVNFTVRLTRSISLVVDALNEMAIADDLKNQCFKFAHDNIVRILKTNQVERYREVETLYLLLAQKKLGRGFRMDTETLAKYFGFDPVPTGGYKSAPHLSIFSITVLLLIIKNSSKHAPLKAAVEACIVEKFKRSKVYKYQNSELLMLYLDMITCPYISDVTKGELDSIFGLNTSDRQSIHSINSHWFTNWGSFDLTLELDKKRARQVY